MFRINNNDFKILIKYKDFLNELDNVLENVPRKDIFFKDKIRKEALNNLEIIMLASIDNAKSLYPFIKSKISFLDFMLERLYNKRYISEKALYNLFTKLVEINKMVNGCLGTYASKPN